MSPLEQMTLDGGAVPHPPTNARELASRMVRRPTELVDVDEFLLAVARALDAAGVAPGDAFYVSRVPPRSRVDEIRPVARSSDPSTSARAARDVAPRAGSQRWRILKAYTFERAFTGDGLTAEQACERARVPGGWRRVSELVAHGYLVETGRERPTSSGSDATVYRITQKGLAVIA